MQEGPVREGKRWVDLEETSEVLDALLRWCYADA